MIENKPSIYNAPSIYNQGGGGGAFVPDGYKIYQILEMKNNNSFPTGGPGLGKIKIDYDDVIIFEADLKPTKPPVNPWDIIFYLRAQSTTGSSQFITAGVSCWNENYGNNYYYYNGSAEFGTAHSYPSQKIHFLTKSYKDKLIINGVTNVVARPHPSSNKFGMVLLGSGVSSEFTFYSLKVFDETEATLKQNWFPALELATSNKGILDLISGAFVKVQTDADATLFAEIIV